MSCMDYFVGFEGLESVGLSQEMRIDCCFLGEPEEELVLVDSTHFTYAVLEGARLNWFDEAFHRHCIVVLIDDSSNSSHHATAANCRSGKRNFLVDEGLLKYLGAISLGQEVQGIRLHLQNKTCALIVFKKNEVSCRVDCRFVN